MGSDDSFDLVLEPGDRYGEFEIIRSLGAGSFAQVFAVRSPQFPEPVALKISHTPITSEDAAIRALREVRILQNLRNRHVVHILDNGLGEDERTYMVMEILHGSTLEDVHPPGSVMAPERALQLVYDACAGLAEAHEMGIVHRDLKPENLWIQADGHVKVLDFGLARAWDRGSTMGADATVGHMLIGTPHYAQPEQVKTGKLTPASDVYSMGVVLYELLCGRTPVFADELVPECVERLLPNPIGWLLAHVRSELVPIDRYPEGRALPEELRRLLHWMLVKEPEDRPASGEVVAESIAWLLRTHYGVEVAGLLRTKQPDGSNPSRLLVPGFYELGNKPDSGIQIAASGEPRTFATLRWLGPGEDAVLTPIEPFGFIQMRINDHPPTGPVRLVPGTYFDVAGTRMVLDYPPPRQ